MTVGSKTSSFHTSMGVVPGQYCPEMDFRRVPYTLPHSTSFITQTSPVLPAGERHPEVDPASQDPGSSQQQRSCSSPCVLHEHVSRFEAKPDFSTDSQCLQSECVHSLFKMETVQSVHAAVCPSDWRFSIDLKDAYLHVPIHPGSYRYLRFALSPTEVFHFRVSPSG